jgi:hypothetical protein
MPALIVNCLTLSRGRPPCVSLCDDCCCQGNQFNIKPWSHIDGIQNNPINGRRISDKEVVGACIAPVCATSTISQSPGLTRLSFETLLARLPSETCGLTQNELFRLFCQTVREFSGASGVCCCHASRQWDWHISESAGHSIWGTQGEILPSRLAESIAEAECVRKAILFQTCPQEAPRV